MIKWTMILTVIGASVVVLAAVGAAAHHDLRYD